jgi:hypothetical protein
VDIETLRTLLEQAWAAETSYEPNRWTSKNPAWGQCAVSALVVQDHFGGELLHGLVAGHEHYWNRIRGGREVDLTQHQFPQDAGAPSKVDVQTREFVLSFPATRRRYDRLLDRLRQMSFED